ncbi:hypothetical protein QP668_28225, partial [Escherichia coli]|nr:hypothetical protein [Escherichia coli]
RVSLNAKALIDSNAMVSNALKFIITYPQIDFNQIRPVIMQRACQDLMYFAGQKWLTIGQKRIFISPGARRWCTDALKKGIIKCKIRNNSC